MFKKKTNLKNKNKNLKKRANQKTRKKTRKDLFLFDTAEALIKCIIKGKAH